MGSAPVQLPGWPEDDRIWDSTAALELREIPKDLAIVGGGIIGLEMATVYSALGCQSDGRRTCGSDRPRRGRARR